MSLAQQLAIVDLFRRLGLWVKLDISVDEARLDQVGEDPLRGSLGDLDLFGDVAEPDIRSARDAKEDLGVVGEEPPGGRGVSFT